MNTDTLKIFTGRSNPQLGIKIAEHLNLPLGKLAIKDFADGEMWIKFEENIRNRDVFIIQSTNGPAKNILELVLILDAAVRASAKSVTAVIPYLVMRGRIEKIHLEFPFQLVLWWTYLWQQEPIEL